LHLLSCDTKRTAIPLSERERRHYDAFAEDDKTFYFFNSFISTLIFDQFLKHIPDSFFKNQIILDLCCGFSRVTRYASHKGCKYAIGIDISYKSLLRGMQRKDMWVHTQRLPYSEKIRYIQGNMENIPLKKSTADVVFIISSLHHLREKERFFNEVKEILRPGGLFIIKDPNGSHYLRKLGNSMGKRWGILSEDEESIGFSETIQLLLKTDFRIQKAVCYNFFTEISGKVTACF
jgi:SAM-dependent methyltransferase